MKNQYFGDVNDYRKYGLLRALTGPGEISTVICWMLTPDDGGPDGRFTNYLLQPKTWRSFDSNLYDKLRDIVTSQRKRNVNLTVEMELIPSARAYNRVLPDDRNERSRYFKAFWDISEGNDLIFFDPDNGIEVKSMRYGWKGSSKYLYWHEFDRAFKKGFSMLVYQHFPRKKRDSFIQQMTEEMRKRSNYL